MGKKYYVYIMTNKWNTVLYVGVTGNLRLRVKQHKDGASFGFTKKYNWNKLVWFHEMEDVAKAIEMEKRLKRWKRKYKESLIEKMNPEWRDLSDDFLPG